MFSLFANKTQLTVYQSEPLTSGSQGIYNVRVSFSSDWEGLEKQLVFQAGTTSISVVLDETCECQIPWETLLEANRQLSCGVYGTRDNIIVLPTVWTPLGKVGQGVVPGEAGKEPTPSVWQQELSKKLDAIALDGLIVLHYGAEIPDGWSLCDGSEGTPDLSEQSVGDCRYIMKTKKGEE